MTRKRIIHPGEILFEEFLKPIGLSNYRLHQITGLPESRLGEIVRGRRGISADTAHRLAAALGNSPEFWMNLQSHYDLELARREHGRSYKRIAPVKEAAGV